MILADFCFHCLDFTFFGERFLIVDTSYDNQKTNQKILLTPAYGSKMCFRIMGDFDNPNLKDDSVKLLWKYMILGY
jgi:hypothetical protein